LVLLLGHYDFRVYVTDECYFDVGAGSLASIDRISMVWPSPGQAGTLGSIGRWCEISSSAEIMSRGEHDHDQPVNITFPTLRTFGQIGGDFGLRPGAPVNIGDGVVISSGAKIRSGVAIGDGAVVGANAVVSHDVAPLSIVGGIPAKPIGQRKPFAPWWDFSMSYLIAKSGDIQAVAASAGPHDFRPDRPRFTVRKAASGYSDFGFTDGDGVRPISQAPSQVQAYLLQAFDLSKTSAYWLADCWDD
jgi:hypothetical protein